MEIFLDIMVVIAVGGLVTTVILYIKEYYETRRTQELEDFAKQEEIERLQKQIRELNDQYLRLSGSVARLMVNYININERLDKKEKENDK